MWPDADRRVSSVRGAKGTSTKAALPRGRSITNGLRIVTEEQRRHALRWLAMTLDHQGAVDNGRGWPQRAAILTFAILQVAIPSLPALGIGEPIGDRSDDVRTLITPAGWAFSIWGPLFAGCLAYAVYQILPAQRRNDLLMRIGWPSAGAFLGNALWALYTQSFGLSIFSAAIIIWTLICLLMLYRTFIETGRPLTKGERFFVVLPLSALASWLTAATIVNIAAALKYHGVELSPLAPTVAAGIVVIGGVIAAAAVWVGRGNPWFAIVFLWALAGIYSAAAQADGPVRIAVLAAAAVVSGSFKIRLTRTGDLRHWLGHAA